MGLFKSHVHLHYNKINKINKIDGIVKFIQN